MFIFSKRFIYTLSNKLRNAPKDSSQEKMLLNFKKLKKSPFDIKSESSYNSYISKGSLVLELKKTNCIAWVEIPEPEFKDHIIEAKIRLDGLGGYASTGIIFRLVEQDSYYLALVSNKGYFRLDVVKNNAPKALIAWTEISNFDGINIELNVNTCGNYLFFLVNGKWVGEINDDSISGGRIGFALASYEKEPEIESGEVQNLDIKDGVQDGAGCTCRALLYCIAVDARIKTIEEKYKKWTDDSNVNAEGRLRLAETFAVMGRSSKALEQIRMAWKRRDDALRSASVSYTEVRTKKELLLASRMSFNLGQYNEAEKFIDLIIEQWQNTPEGKWALSEKIKILNELNKLKELKEFLLKYYNAINKDIDYFTMLARCFSELKEYKEAAETWKKVFKINSENGVYAVNAANALELTGKKKEALKFYLVAGNLFLKQNNQAELEVIMPKLSLLGAKNWEARTLAGKWLFSIEDYARCAEEFAEAEKLRCALEPRPKADPALFYLWGLVFSIRGKYKDSVRLLKKAVELAPDYGLFRFKLAEIKLKSGDKDNNLYDELKSALELYGEDTSMAAHAGNLLLEAGYPPEKVQYFFALAAGVNEPETQPDNFCAEPNQIPNRANDNAGN